MNNILDYTIQPLPTFYNFTDHTNATFARLTARHYVGKARWLCECECGNQTIVSTENLVSGHTKSCGCLATESRKTRHLTHGNSKRGNRTAEYSTFSNAKNRCENPANPAFVHYGGRGIEFRFNSFEDFLDYMGLKPSPKHSLDRIDNDGHYEKGNLRWATQKEQCQNTRRSLKITVGDTTQSASEWSELHGVPLHNIYQRIDKLGWCAKCAVSLSSYQSCNHKSKVSPD